MGISRADFGSFICEQVTRNPTMGIPALQDILFANLLIFDYLHYIFVFGKGREGNGKGKGKASLQEFRHVWTNLFDEIGRVWTSFDEFRRVSTSLDEFRRVPNEIRRVWTSFDEIDYKSKVLFSKTSSHSWQYKQSVSRNENLTQCELICHQGPPQPMRQKNEINDF